MPDASRRLIRAGAFDCLDDRRPNLLRSQLLCVLPRAIQSGQSKQDDRRRGQLGLFDDARIEGPAGLEKWRERPCGGDCLRCRKWRRCRMRICLPGRRKRWVSTFRAIRSRGMPDLLRALSTHHAADLPSVAEKTEVILGGMITNVKERNVQKSRSGLTRMAKLTFEDLSGTAAGDAVAGGIRQDGGIREGRSDRVREGHA